MKILILGGFGYLGGRIAESLSSNKIFEVILVSSQNRDSKEWITNCSFVQIDWEEFDNLNEICKGVDIVIHASGMNAQDCLKDPAEAVRVNGLYTCKILEAAINNNVKRFIYFSTAHVYDNQLSGYIDEEKCAKSLNPYATSHRVAEDSILFAHSKKKIIGIVIRLSNSFGAPVYPNVNCWMLFVNDLCLQAIDSGIMTLNSAGTQQRNFIPLSDVTRAIEHLIELKMELIGNGLFNLGSNWTPTLLEMAKRLATCCEEILLKKVDIHVNCKNPTSLKEQNPSHLEYSIKKLTSTGFTASDFNQIDIELKNLIRFCNEHRAIIRINNN